MQGWQGSSWGNAGFGREIEREIVEFMILGGWGLLLGVEVIVGGWIVFGFVYNKFGVYSMEFIKG